VDPENDLNLHTLDRRVARGDSQREYRFQRLSDLVSGGFELDRRPWKEAVLGARQAEILPKHRTLVFAAKERIMAQRDRERCAVVVYETVEPRPLLARFDHGVANNDESAWQNLQMVAIATELLHVPFHVGIEERGFRKLAGYRAIPILVAVLHAHDVQFNRTERRVDDTEKAA